MIELFQKTYAVARTPAGTTFPLRRQSRETASSVIWALDGQAQPPEFVALSNEKPRSIQGTPECWVHLATYGAWDGHPAGHFEFTRELFEKLIARLDAQKNPIPWTVGHPWGTEAAPGWLRRLAILGSGAGEHDGLYGLTEWTAQTATQIREGGWRYCSVVVDLEAVDRVTGQTVGPELIEVGLTNKPFIDGQKQIELSRDGKETQTMKPQEVVLAFARALGLVPASVKLDAEGEITKAIAAAAKAVNLPKEAGVDKIIAKLNAMAAYLATLTDGGGDAAGGDAAAAMSRPDAAKWAKRAEKLAHLDDSPNWTGGGTMADPSADPDAASDQAVIAALDAAGIDTAAFATWLGSADNISALAAMIAGPADQAALARGDKATMLTLQAQVREGNTKLAAATARIVELENAEKARQTAAVDAERETLITGAKERGVITAEATETEVREVFKLSHEAGKRMLAALPQVVPTGRFQAPPPKNANEVRKDGAVEFDFTPKDGAEEAIVTANQRNPVKMKRLLERYRAQKTKQDETQGQGA